MDAVSVAMAIEVVLSESSTRPCHGDDALWCYGDALRCDDDDDDGDDDDDDALWCKMHQGAMLDALSRGDVQCIHKFNPG